jgi:bifunctional non-homologous end joining protein LigD
VHARSAILDGELVVFDDDGRPRFELVQNSGAGAPRQAVLQLFDVLQIDGTDTIELPYEDRRRLLDELVEPAPTGRCRTTASATVRSWSRPRPARVSRGDRQAARIALPPGHPHEGLVEDQEPHGRRPDDRGIHDGHRASGVDVRFTAGRPSNRWRTAFAGGVGTGFDQRTLETLTARLRGLAVDECPFEPPPPPAVRRTATWVEPVLRATVEIAEFTNDGLVRHASFVP